MTAGPCTVLLVGAGAVEGAGAPVIKAVQARLSPSAGTEDAATVALANLVINLRWFAHASVALPSNAGAAKSLGLLREHRAALCTRIAEELACHEADGSLCLRQDFDVLWQDATRDCECAVVTTNWDRVIASWITRRCGAGKEALLHHLHGDRTDSTALLLPSEVAFEPYFEPDHSKTLLSKRRDILHAVERADRVLTRSCSTSLAARQPSVRRRSSRS